jgi:hypothetical protein
MHLYYTTVNLQKNIYLEREPKPLYTEDLCAIAQSCINESREDIN